MQMLANRNTIKFTSQMLLRLLYNTYLEDSRLSRHLAFLKIMLMDVTLGSADIIIKRN